MREPGSRGESVPSAGAVRAVEASLSASSTHLAADGVTLSRGGRPVLHRITTAIQRARVTALVGPSGSGKSSLLRCLNRLEEPQSGRVLLSGTDIREIPPVELRCRVGLIGQRPVIFPGGVRANLAYGLEEPETARFVDSLGAVGLPAEFLDRPSDALSGGEAQRVSIARALMRDPEVLLLDEPTSALDKDAVRTVEALIGSLCARGLTMVVVTHNLAQAARIASTGKLLVGGRLVAEGTMEQVRSAWPGDEP